jgi:hypothetical protein
MHRNGRPDRLVIPGTAAAVLASSLLSLAGAAAAGEGEAPHGLDFKGRPPQPEMALPPCGRAPTIDGEFAAEEWADAACLSSLAQGGKANGLAWPATHVYLAYDAEYFYFAFRCPKRSPRWYRAKSRFRDSPVYLDRNYVEFYLSPPPRKGAHREVYQFNVNAYGAIADWRRIQAIGLTQTGYNPKIDLATAETDRLWTLEGRLRAEDLAAGGFRPDQTWLANVARSWPQRAWSFRPGFYIEPRNMGRLHLRPEAPVVQWLDLSSLHTGALNLKVRVKNLSKGEQTVRLSAKVTGESAADGLAAASAKVTLRPGEARDVVLHSDSRFVGRRGHVELACTGPRGERTWYHQVLRFGAAYADAVREADAAAKPAPFPAELGVDARYGQLAEAVEVKADVWFLRRAGRRPAAVTLRVLPAGAEDPVAERTLSHFQKDMAIARIDLPDDAPYGPYRVQAQAADADGEPIATGEATFERLDLASDEVNRPRRVRGGRLLDWIGNTIGESPQVLPPWTPVRADGRTVRVWGRTHRLGPAGLPEQIASGGADLLAGPIRLVAAAGGKDVLAAAEQKLEAATNLHASQATWESRLSGGGLSAVLRARLEYDGLIRYRLKLDCPQPVALDEMYLDIPIRGELAKIMNLHSGTAFLDDRQGLLWESRSACDNPLVGTLTPHVWIGDDFRGLAWIADHTRGWYERPHRSVLTLRRDGDTVHLRAHLVRGPAKVESTAMDFALLATPTKPPMRRWRDYPHGEHWQYHWFRGWFGMCVKEDGRQVCNWDDPTEAAVTEGVERAAAENRQDQLCLPYNNPNFTVPHPMPWAVDNASPVSKLLWEDWVTMPARGTVKPVASYRDWAVANMAYWMALQAYAGWYVDESYGGENFNVNTLNGSGWFDRHGNLRGSYQSLGVRDLFKRMYAVSHRLGRTGRGFILNHVSTFGMAPHVMSFARAGCFGEGMGVHEDTHSILDAVSLRNLRFYSGKAWGFFGTYFGFYHARNWGSKTPEARQLCRRSVANTYGVLMLHDMVPTEGWIAGGWGAMPEVKKRFGIAADDVAFVGYWYPDPPVASDAEAVKASTYLRPGKALVVAVNTDTRAAHAAALTLDPQKLGLTAGPIEAEDPDSGQGVPVKDGRIAVKLGPRRVAYFLLK